MKEIFQYTYELIFLNLKQQLYFDSAQKQIKLAKCLCFVVYLFDSFFKTD